MSLINNWIFKHSMGHHISWKDTRFHMKTLEVLQTSPFWTWSSPPSCLQLMADLHFTTFMTLMLTYSLLPMPPPLSCLVVTLLPSPSPPCSTLSQTLVLGSAILPPSHIPERNLKTPYVVCLYLSFTSEWFPPHIWTYPPILYITLSHCWSTVMPQARPLSEPLYPNAPSALFCAFPRPASPTSSTYPVGCPSST